MHECNFYFTLFFSVWCSRYCFSRVSKGQTKFHQIFALLWGNLRKSNEISQSLPSGNGQNFHSKGTWNFVLPELTFRIDNVVDRCSQILVHRCRPWVLICLYHEHIHNIYSSYLWQYLNNVKYSKYQLFIKRNFAILKCKHVCIESLKLTCVCLFFFFCLLFEILIFLFVPFDLTHWA